MSPIQRAKVDIEIFPSSNLSCYPLRSWYRTEYSRARIIWPSLFRTPCLICTIVQDTTMSHWHPMLNCPLNSHAIFAQSCLICTFSCHFCTFLVFFQVLSAGGRGVPLSPVACVCSRNCLFCFKCDSCTSLYLEINSKVDFDAIKLYFWKNWLFIHFFCRFLHLPDSTVWSTRMTQPEKHFQ